MSYADFAAHVRTLAHNKREDAGYSGSWGDGGARDLEEKVECWESGLRGEVPKCLETYHKEYKKVMDPEYSEYLRLQKKFKT